MHPVFAIAVSLFALVAVPGSGIVDGGCGHPVAVAGLLPPPLEPPCQKIGPGGALVLPVAFFGDLIYCSMSFVVTDGVDLFVASAGHCSARTDPTFPEIGDPVHALGVGEFGHIAYQWCAGQAVGGSGDGCGLGTDFQLIKINRENWGDVDPTMCAWGAAEGLFTHFGDALYGDEALGTVDFDPWPTYHFGWGMALGDPASPFPTVGNPATQARQGLGMDFTHPSAALMQGAAASGDSGSGVLISALDPLGEPQMLALGVLTHVSNVGIFVQRLDVSLDHMAAQIEADTGASVAFSLVRSTADFPAQAAKLHRQT